MLTCALELANAAERKLSVSTPVDPAIAHCSPHRGGPYGGPTLPGGQDHAGAQVVSTNGGRHWPGADAPGGSLKGWHDGESLYPPERNSIHANFPYNQSDERLGVGFLLGDNRHEQRAMHMSMGGEPPPWSTVPKFLEPSNALDSILMDFLTERTRLAAMGTSRDELVGPETLNVDSWVDPSSPTVPHEMSRIMIDIIGTFPDISRLPEKVAVVYTMFTLMRWFVQPTRVNYDRMPCWMRPEPSQLSTPHPHWLNYLPW